MKTTTLKILIDLFFVTTVIALGIYLAAILYAAFLTSNVPSGLDSPSDFVGLRGIAYLISIIYTIIFVLFTLAIYYLRKSILPLIKGDYFSNKVIVNLNRCGQLLAISGFGMLIYYISKKLILTEKLWLGIDDSILGFLFLMTIGLFLKLLSSVFKNSKMLKEENDLTI